MGPLLGRSMTILLHGHSMSKNDLLSALLADTVLFPTSSLTSRLATVLSTLPGS